MKNKCSQCNRRVDEIHDLTFSDFVSTKSEEEKEYWMVCEICAMESENEEMPIEMFYMP